MTAFSDNIMKLVPSVRENTVVEMEYIDVTGVQGGRLLAKENPGL